MQIKLPRKSPRSIHLADILADNDVVVVAVKQLPADVTGSLKIVESTLVDDIPSIGCHVSAVWSDGEGVVVAKVDCGAPAARDTDTCQARDKYMFQLKVEW